MSPPQAAGGGDINTPFGGWGVVGTPYRLRRRVGQQFWGVYGLITVARTGTSHVGYPNGVSHTGDGHYPTGEGTCSPWENVGTDLVHGRPDWVT